MFGIDQMNHYQKLAVLLIRFVGSVCTLIGILGLLYAAIIFLAFNRLVPGYERWPASILYALVGIVIYRLSPLLGKALGRGLE